MGNGTAVTVNIFTFNFTSNFNGKKSGLFSDEHKMLQLKYNTRIFGATLEHFSYTFHLLNSFTYKMCF